MRYGLLGIVISLAAFVADVPSQEVPTSTQRLINVTVETKGGWIKNLKVKDFGLLVDNVSEEITFFRPGNAPSSIGFLIDTSGSVRSNVNIGVSEALLEFVSKGKSRNEFCVMAFGVTNGVLRGFTSDTNELEKALKDVVATAPYGNTKLYDALKTGIDQLRGGKNQRKVLIVITDGQDNISKMSIDKIKQVVKESDAVVYFLSFSEPLAYPDQMEMGAPVSTALGFMRDISEMSGGRMFVANRPDRLSSALYQIWEELEEQYQIGFSNKTKKQPDGKPIWHSIKVKVTLPDSVKSAEKPKVVTRAGFYSFN